MLKRFAEMTYSNLRDKSNGINQNGEEIAMGAHNLVSVITKTNGDLIKAEVLARESLRIRILIYGDHRRVAISCDLLASILRAQGKLGDKTKKLYERSLVLFIKCDGANGPNAAAGNLNRGGFHHRLAVMQHTIGAKRTELLLAKSYYDEGLRIYLEICGPTHPDTAFVQPRLSEVLSDIVNNV